MANDIFGSGLEVPARVTARGALALRTGDDRLLDGVEAILCTPQGSCPMDPRFGLALDAYDPVDDINELAWAITRAVEYGEPRVQQVDAIIERVDALNGVVEIRVEVVPRGGTTPLTRTFPFYRKE